MQGREDIRSLRQELRNVHSIRLNEQPGSRVQARIEAACAARIKQIEAELKRYLQTEAFRVARINWIDGELNSRSVGSAPQPLAQQWP